MNKTVAMPGTITSVCCVCKIVLGVQKNCALKDGISHGYCREDGIKAFLEIGMTLAEAIAEIDNG